MHDPASEPVPPVGGTIAPVVRAVDARLAALIDAGAPLVRLADGGIWTEGPVWLPREQALRYSDQCVVLQSGQVVASGKTAEVLTPGLIRQVWDVRACPVQTAGLFEGSTGGLQYLFEPAPMEGLPDAHF